MCREPAAPGSRYCVPCLAVRKLVLERDGYACIDCGTSIIGQHYSLGHRLRASQGGKPVPPGRGFRDQPASHRAKGLRTVNETGEGRQNAGHQACKDGQGIFKKGNGVRESH